MCGSTEIWWLYGVFICNPSKVIADTPIPPGATLSEVILAMSLQILSKLTVNWPPSPPTTFFPELSVDWPPPLPSLPTYNFLSWLECWLTPSPHSPPTTFFPELSVDWPPPLSPHLQLSFLSWVLIDPPSLPPSPPTTFFPELSVDWPPLCWSGADQQILSKILHIPTKPHDFFHRGHSHRESPINCKSVLRKSIANKA